MKPGTKRHRSRANLAGLVTRWSITAKIFAGTLIGTAACVAAWKTIGLPIPASTTYVDAAINAKVTDIIRRIDEVDSTTLQNRIETLFSTRNRDQGELSDLDFRLKTAKSDADPNYLSLIRARQQELNDEVLRLNAQISAAQNAINKKTTTTGSSPPS